MSISLKTQKLLWGRAAGRCSEPSCRLDLFEDETEADDATHVGENCHIHADSNDGPRAEPAMSMEARNSYANLILLCRNHHKIIDSQVATYSAKILQEMKRSHEAWVRSQLGFDDAKVRDDVYYAALVDKWDELAWVGNWKGWSSSILSFDQPKMAKKLDANLSELRDWLLSRVWPGRYPLLEAAFHNFRNVLESFHEKFRDHMEPFGSDGLITKRFYKIAEWDEARYARLASRYDFHVALVGDLMLELTRAANLICDRVRESIKFSYRLDTGRLIVQSGPTEEFAFHDFVVQYSSEERSATYPYPGLEKFLIERSQRDRHFGKGEKPQ